MSSNGTSHDHDRRETLEELARFPLLTALFGRRARRFGLGMTIPSGPFAYVSRHEPVPLSDEERLLLILAGAGVTGWNLGIPHTTSVASDKAANYANRLIGRPQPSGAGVHSTELLVTDDSGAWITNFRNLDPTRLREYEAVQDLDRLAEIYEPFIVRLSSGRIDVPAEVPHMFAHNFWVANRPGTTMFIPIADTTEYTLTVLAILAGEGYVVWNSEEDRPFGDPGPLLAKGVLASDPGLRLALRDLDASTFAALATETGIMAYNIQLLLQAFGLGGWLYNGINALSWLGAFADNGVPGFGFRFSRRDEWRLPNALGLDGHFEPLAPPYHADLRAAVETFYDRRFGAGGTWDPARPGPYRDSPGIKASVERYSPELVDYLASVAQDVYDTHGRFPGTIPTVYAGIYTQAHHIDLGYYDEFYGPQSYLETHARHFERWHGGVAPAEERAPAEVAI